MGDNGTTESGVVEPDVVTEDVDATTDDGDETTDEVVTDEVETDVAEADGPIEDGPIEDGAIEDGAMFSAGSVIEAVLFSADGPLPAQKLARVLGIGGVRDVKQHIAALNEGYESRGAGFRIDEVAGGFQMLTQPEFHPWIAKLRKTKAMTKLSQAALETLAVVAYKQPALRADIESVRGVASGEVVNRLREMGLVKIVGRAEEIGRPMLYGTTRKFLEVFGLQRIEDLPSVEELKPPA